MPSSVITVAHQDCFSSTAPRLWGGGNQRILAAVLGAPLASGDPTYTHQLEMHPHHGMTNSGNTPGRLTTHHTIAVSRRPPQSHKECHTEGRHAGCTPRCKDEALSRGGPYCMVAATPAPCHPRRAPALAVCRCSTVEPGLGLLCVLVNHTGCFEPPQACTILSLSFVCCCVGATCRHTCCGRRRPPHTTLLLAVALDALTYKTTHMHTYRVGIQHTHRGGDTSAAPTHPRTQPRGGRAHLLTHSSLGKCSA